MSTRSPIPDDLPKQLEREGNSRGHLASMVRTLIAEASRSDQPGPVVRVTERTLCDQALKHFGPQMPACASFYELGIHRKTGALIIASPPTVISAKTEAFGLPLTLRYQALAVYLPGLGVEIASVGCIGDIESRPFVLRSESACTPSILFGSMTCNCASQWRCTQALAASFNADGLNDQEKIGFLMIHLENQNGMGIGYATDPFTLEANTRSHLRHGAALATGQKYQLSIQDTFSAINLPNDPRRTSSGAGYRVTPVVMDFLATHPEMILLSNNPKKLAALQEAGFTPMRLPLSGEITQAGMAEARERQTALGHIDIGNHTSTLDEEFFRLKTAIQATCLKRRTYAG